MTHLLVITVTALLGTAAFAILFRVSPKNLPFAAVGGLITCLIFEIFESCVKNPLVSGFAASLFLALYSEILARLLRTSALTFVLPGAIPIVPGGSLYYTVYNLFFYDLNEFAYHGKRMIAIILGMAVGMSVTSIIVGGTLHIIRWIKEKKC